MKTDRENQIIHPPASGRSKYPRFQNANSLESCKIILYEVPIKNSITQKVKKTIKATKMLQLSIKFKDTKKIDENKI